MSNLLVISAIKKAQDGNKRYTSKKINRDERNNNRNIDGESHHSFEEHLNMLVSSNEDLKKFFKKLAENGEEIDKIDNQQSKEAVQKLCEEYSTKKQECEQLLSEVENIGVSISTDIRSEEHYGAVETAEGRGFGGVGRYSYSRETTFCIGFNGIEITRDMLNDSGNPYEQEFLAWESENMNIDNEITSLREQINKKKASLRINPFNRSAKKEEIVDMEQELAVLEGKYNDGIKKKFQMEVFAGLTDEQKQKIAQYLDSVGECQEIGDNIRDKVDESVLLAMHKLDDQRGKWARAFEIMLASGQISQEEIDQVREILLKEIQEREENYPDGKMAYEMNEIYPLTASAIEWYTEQVGNEIGHKSPLTPLQKRESVLAGLETEAEKISETEALIDKRNVREGKNIGEE